MGLETGNYIEDLNVSNPLTGDGRSEGDDHLRLIKLAVKQTFPGLAGRFTRFQTKSAGYSPALTDNWSVLNCSAGLTLTPVAAATLGNGWAVFVIAAGGAVVVDPNGSELVNGALTVTLPSGMAGLLLCSGTAFTLLPFKLTLNNTTEVPAGALLDFAGSTPPAGYLLCDGTAVSRTTYATLFAVIGTIWGVGDGSTTFNLPDFRRRVAVGSGGAGTGTLGNSVGNTGGEEAHTLTVAESATHSHVVNDPGHLHSAASQVAPFYGQPTGGGPIGTGSTGSAVTGITLQNTGGGGAHNNMQPSAVVTKIIKV